MPNTRQFLNTLYPYEIPEDRRIETRIDTQDGIVRTYHNTVDSLLQTAREYVDIANSIWFGPGLRLGEHGRDVDVVSIPALWSDCDVKLFNGDMQRALKCLYDAPHIPSIIVNTGHGYQAYWLLDTPAENEQIKEASSAMRWLQDTLSSGLKTKLDSVHNPSRVMRLPNTWNRKDTPVPCTIVRFSEVRFSLRDFGRSEERSSADNTALVFDVPKEKDSKALLDKAKENGLPGWVNQALFRPEFYHKGDDSSLDWRVALELVKVLTLGEAEIVWMKSYLGRRASGDSKVLTRVEIGRAHV